MWFDKHSENSETEISPQRVKLLKLNISLAYHRVSLRRDGYALPL